MAIHGVLFDIGDTLLPATRVQHTALASTASVMADRAAIPDAALFQHAYLVQDQNPALDADPTINHLYSDERIVMAALEALRWPGSYALAHRFLDIYREQVRSSIVPNSRLTHLLEDLTSQGVRLGVASNGTSREQREQLDRLGVAGYFSPILISQELGCTKPEPEFFRHASERWHLDPGVILVVGDRVDWEVIGAHNAGMQSGLLVEFVNRTSEIGAESRPDFIIERLSEVAALVRSHNESRPAR